MTHVSARRFLDQSRTELESARKHLDFSAGRVLSLPADLQSISDAELESAEAFKSRFARTVDLLVNKVLRALDRVELKPPGTLLDVVNGAEQRGFVPNASILREMKAVRIEVAHDYAGLRLPEVSSFCRDRKSDLNAICDRTRDYINRLSV